MNFKKMKLYRMSLPFASLAERGVISDIYNKPFEIACEYLFSNLKMNLNQI